MQPISYRLKADHIAGISSEVLSRIEIHEDYDDCFTKYHITREDKETVLVKYGYEVCWQCEKEPTRDDYTAEGKQFCSAKCLIEYLSVGDEESRRDDAFLPER